MSFAAAEEMSSVEAVPNRVGEVARETVSIRSVLWQTVPEFTHATVWVKYAPTELGPYRDVYRALCKALFRVVCSMFVALIFQVFSM